MTSINFPHIRLALARGLLHSTHQNYRLLFIRTFFNFDYFISSIIFLSIISSSSVHRRQFIVVMKAMRLSLTNTKYISLSALINAINEHVEAEEYAIVRIRIKTFKKRVVKKCVFKCDRENEAKNNHATDKRFDFFRLIDCSFSAIALLIENEWQLTIRNDTHNHEIILRDAHLVLRKMTMTHEMKQNIAHQFKTQITSTTILINLRLNDNNNSKNFIFKSKNIYNVKTFIKRRALSSLTSIQAFIKFLNEAEYHLQYEKNETDQITRLFFFENFFSAYFEN